MSHQIEEYDVTFSTSSPEWHGLAIVKTAKEMIGAIRKLFLPIVEGEATLTVEGKTIPLMNENGKGWKVIAADCRELEEIDGRAVHPPAFVPLHTPRQSYAPIPNQRVFEAIDKAFDLAGINYELATCGTLGNLSRFYLSIAVEGLGIKCPRGFEIQSYLTAVTAHNGSHDFRVMDSHVKPVCANTVGAIMRNHGDVNFKIRHTANCEIEIQELEKTLADFFQGHADLTAAMASLESAPMSRDEMLATAAGYFALPLVSDKRTAEQVAKMKLSPQSRNAVEGIADLAKSGKGNSGKTAYDLFNGATDYWSNGAGVGSEKVSMQKKAYRSHFGSAHAHKRDFSSYLFDDERRESGKALGAQVWETTLKS